jgi:hypothetical protein
MGFEVDIGGLVSTGSALGCLLDPLRGDGLRDWLGDLREGVGGDGRR